MDPIYLDHNATTPTHPEVVDAMLTNSWEHFGNPSSGHAFGKRARAALDEARRRVADLLGCSPVEILFTSGGTEATNLAIRGFAQACGVTGTVVTTAVEHPATLRCCERLAERGWALDRLPVDAHGVARVPEFLAPDTRLVAAMHANNETGAIQPIARLSALAKRVGAVVHVDAAQSAGKVPVRVDDLGADLLTIAGHKLYGPKGIGALYVRAGTPLAPLLLGAGHERGLRPGTENVAGAVGLGVACFLAKRDVDAEARRLRGLGARLWSRLRERIPGLQLNGPPTDRLPNTWNLSFPGVSGRALLAACPEVAASTGSACHEGGEETPSAVLKAAGMDDARALGAVRISLGRDTTPEEIERAAEALLAAWNKLVWTE